MKSSSATTSQAARIISICGRNSLATDVRIRMISRRSSICSSRMRLFVCTTSAGSINTVLPDADSSCTIPEIFRLCIGGTGITIRPSRIDGAVSGSIRPAATADAITLRMAAAMLPAAAASDLLISASAAEAESLILPKRSRTRSMTASGAGNDTSPSTTLSRRGYRPSVLALTKNASISPIACNVDRNTGSSSAAGKVPGILIAETMERTSPACPNGNRSPSAERMIDSISAVESNFCSTSAKSEEKVILSHISAPIGDRHFAFTAARTEAKPILFSKLVGGYIIRKSRLQECCCFQ